MLYNGGVIDYEIVRSKKLSSRVSLNIKDGRVIVRAPFWVPKFTIDGFVASRSAWITQALKKSPLKNETTLNYEVGEKHLFFGQEYILQINLESGMVRSSVSIDENSLVVTVSSHHSPENQKKEIKEALLRFYLEKLVDYLTEVSNKYCLLLGVDYSKIEVKKVSSIWGSCSAKNVLSFNRKLAMAPKKIVDYVIIHEVCHLRERNHSSRFWGLVFKFDRDYKQNRKWLRDNHMLLTI